MGRIASAIVVLAAVLIFSGESAQAAELVMFEEPGCIWCRRWHGEIGPGYPHTSEGRVAPLRRVHIRDQAMAGVSLEKPVTLTPTFVLIEDGREVGRIVGYPGNEFFYGLLAGLLGRLPKGPAPHVIRPDPAGGRILAAERVLPIANVINVIHIVDDGRSPIRQRGTRKNDADTLQQGGRGA